MQQMVAVNNKIVDAGILRQWKAIATVFTFFFAFIVLVSNNWFCNETFSGTVDIGSIVQRQREEMVSGAVDVGNIIQRQREQIAEEMAGYIFPDGRIRYLDLVPELGGISEKTIIVTTWRSGSSFFGDLLASHPAQYYHFEPLMQYLIRRFRSLTEAQLAVDQCQQMLNCKYDNRDFLTYSKLQLGHTSKDAFKRNTRLWQYCQDEDGLCYTPSFLEPFCKIFPFQLMKILRIRLQLAQQFLTNDSLNARVVYLVRDPRGTLHSRKQLVWCRDEPDCDDPQRVCEDLESDFRSAVKFSSLFPSKFMIIRYEDLSLDLFNTTNQVLKFMGLNFHENVLEFLRTHTEVQDNNLYSTTRNSKKTAFRWKTESEYSEVESIQRHCRSALKLWGYQLAHNASHQRNFFPLLPFHLS